MFIGYQNDKIAFIAETKEELENMPCVTLDKIEETGVEYVSHNGEYKPKAEVEALLRRENTASQIAELKAELGKTDYIDNKFIEAIVKNDMILLDTLKVKYKDKLEERQAIRNQIDELREIIDDTI
jgi:hypothetical protein